MPVARRVLPRNVEGERAVKTALFFVLPLVPVIVENPEETK